MSDDQDGCKWVSFLLVPAHPGSPGSTAVKWMCVCVCVCRVSCVVCRVSCVVCRARARARAHARARARACVCWIRARAVFLQ